MHHRPAAPEDHPAFIRASCRRPGRDSSAPDGGRMIVVAHRGASGHRPEHTLDAYRTAVRMGADDIEVDLVITRDGVLVARHDAELARTTDVADHPELAHLRTTRTIDGVETTGWFVEDLTWAQVRTLSARERMPRARPANTAYDGTQGVAAFSEVLTMVRAESVRRGRPVGVMVELKHAARFESVGLPLDAPLLAHLARHGLDHPWARVTLMSFEPRVLRRLAGRTRLPIVQLLEAHRSGVDLGLVGEYADGIGPHKDLVLPRDLGGAVGQPSALVRDAHRAGLTVHVWTLRAENRFLPANLRVGADPDAHGDMAGEVRALLDAGVDGVITDHPDVARRALREVRPSVVARVT
jgi:glycerophosphoryl diester phosphodiesterase